MTISTKNEAAEMPPATDRKWTSLLVKVDLSETISQRVSNQFGWNDDQQLARNEASKL
jgi:hypothetical protein